MMKADVLSIFPVIKICTQYKLKDGSITDALPYELVREQITPVYKELKGWNVPLTGTSLADLPHELIQYIDFLEVTLNVPITLISTGPDRTQTIFKPAGAK